MDSASLVAEIKRLQREDTAAKEGWWGYCDEFGSGVRDPAKHEATFLQGFLQQHSQGLLPIFSGSGGGGRGGGSIDPALDWGAFFKEMQRKSEGFRQQWAGYCAMYGDGKNDPTKKQKEFMIKFIDHLCSGGAAMGFAGDMGPPAKRARTGGCGAVPTADPMMAMMQQMMGGGMMGGGMMGGGGGCGGDPNKMRLVERIKAYQRADPIQKEAWWAYADTQLKGVRDPAKHDAGVLSTFAQMHGVP